MVIFEGFPILFLIHFFFEVPVWIYHPYSHQMKGNDQLPHLVLTL